MKRTNTKSVTEATTKTTPAKTEKVTEKATKKAATKKSTVKKEVKEVKETVFVQYAGQEYDINEIRAAVKKAWTEETGKKESDITEIQIYVKPEEAAAYYVVNGEVTEGGNKILL